MDLRQRPNGRQVAQPGVYRRVHSNEEYSGYKITSVLGVMPVVGLVLCAAVYTITGLVCVGALPPFSSSGGGSREQQCLRATRRGDYATVHAIIGSPPRRFELLLRLDRVSTSSEAPAMRVFSPKLIESATLNCQNISSPGATHDCTDTLLVVSEAVGAVQRRVVVKFAYTNYLYEIDTPADNAGIAGVRLRLDGELSMRAGYEYELSDRHLCWRASFSTPVAFADAARTFSVSVNLETGALFAEADAIDNAPSASFAKKALGVCHNHAATETPVAVFPHVAADDLTFLRVIDPLLQQNEPDAVLRRRNVVEAGTACAGELNGYARDVAAYQLDCVDACRVEPSIPFRAVASMHIHAFFSTTSAVFVFSRLRSLGFLSSALAYMDEIALAAMKLGLTILAASLAFTRRKRSFARPDYLINACLERVCAAGSGANAKWARNNGTDADNMFEDAVIGALAIVSRFAMAFWRLQTSGDDMRRVCIVNIVAACVSALHFLARNFVIEPSLLERGADGDSPVGRLGGSSGLADAIAAILLAMSHPPLLDVTKAHFENSARLLVAMAAMTSLLPRLIFAAGCVALQYEAGALTRLREEFRWLLGASVIFWILQSAALAISIADLVAYPLFLTLAIHTIGDGTPIACAAFLSSIALSIPRLLHSTVRIKRISCD